MTSFYASLLLYGNFSILILVYLHLLKIKKLVGFQLGMNIAVIAGGLFAMSTGIVLIYEYPLQFVSMTIIAATLGMITGGLFGTLFDYQTMLTGYANGLMSGIMAPMVGAAAKQSLPFLAFIEVLFILSLIGIALVPRRF